MAPRNRNNFNSLTCELISHTNCSTHWSSQIEWSDLFWKFTISAIRWRRIDYYRMNDSYQQQININFIRTIVRIWNCNKFFFFFFVFCALFCCCWCVFVWTKYVQFNWKIMVRLNKFPPRKRFMLKLGEINQSHTMLAHFSLRLSLYDEEKNRSNLFAAIQKQHFTSLTFNWSYEIEPYPMRRWYLWINDTRKKQNAYENTIHPK